MILPSASRRAGTDAISFYGGYTNLLRGGLGDTVSS